MITVFTFGTLKTSRKLERFLHSFITILVFGELRCVGLNIVKKRLQDLLQIKFSGLTTLINFHCRYFQTLLPIIKYRMVHFSLVLQMALSECGTLKQVMVVLFYSHL